MRIHARGAQHLTHESARCAALEMTMTFKTRLMTLFFAAALCAPVAYATALQAAHIFG